MGRFRDNLLRKTLDASDQGECLGFRDWGKDYVIAPALSFTNAPNFAKLADQSGGRGS